MELNVLNLYNVLKDFDFDENRKRESFLKISKILLDKFFKGYKSLRIPIAINKKIQNPIYSNDSLKFDRSYRILKNVTFFDIEQLYPSIITKITEFGNYNLIDHSKEDPFEEELWSDGIQDKLLWNIPEFSILFKYIFDNQNNLLNLHDKENYQNIKVKSIVRLILNETQKFLEEEEDFLRINNIDLIHSVLGDLLKELRSFKNMIFFKWDSICFLDFEKVENQVLEKLNSLDFKYEVKKYNNLIYFNPYRYIFTDEIFQSEGVFFKENLEKTKPEIKYNSEFFYSFDGPNNWDR